MACTVSNSGFMYWGNTPISGCSALTTDDIEVACIITFDQASINPTIWLYVLYSLSRR